MPFLRSSPTCELWAAHCEETGIYEDAEPGVVECQDVSPLVASQLYDSAAMRPVYPRDAQLASKQLSEQPCLPVKRLDRMMSVESDGSSADGNQHTAGPGCCPDLSTGTAGDTNWRLGLVHVNPRRSSLQIPG